MNMTNYWRMFGHWPILTSLATLVLLPVILAITALFLVGYAVAATISLFNKR